MAIKQIYKLINYHPARSCKEVESIYTVAGSQNL